jgi:hypothetical protein
MVWPEAADEEAGAAAGALLLAGAALLAAGALEDAGAAEDELQAVMETAMATSRTTLIADFRTFPIFINSLLFYRQR